MLASFSSRTTAIVAAMMNVSTKDIYSHTRRRSITNARQTAMFLTRAVKGKDFSFPMIGQQFGRDHTTVIHAIETVRKRIATDPKFASRLTVLLGEVQAMAVADARNAQRHRITNAMMLPLRITTHQVCDLAGFGPQTLNKRILAGTMPKPVDVARERLFDRDAVLLALGIIKTETPEVASW